MPFAKPTSLLINFNDDIIAGTPAANFLGFSRDIPVNSTGG